MRHPSCLYRKARSSALRALALATIATAMAPDVASATSTLDTLHSFCAWQNCNDGSEPVGALVMDGAGSIYGTGQTDGKYDGGVVFKLVPNGSGYDETVLKNFCSKTNCTDGKYPVGDLVIDVNGNLYGVTYAGGKYDIGVIIKIVPGVSGKLLHVFNGNGGAKPAGGLTYAGQSSGAPWDGSSPLYGTTQYGGTYDNGVAFQLTPNGTSWTYQVIHTFHTASGPNALIMDGAGNLFGTTQQDGANGGGNLYKLAKGTWTQTILHNFCSQQNCADGSEPWGRLAMDASGNLFGTTRTGGGNIYNAGVVFERPSGGGYKVLYTFCSQNTCLDGGGPVAGVTVDRFGHLFGTTPYGGQKHLGASGLVFELTNSNGTWSETRLYSFCAQQNCADGYQPTGPVMLDSSGNLFGVTIAGGANGDHGTVFKLAPASR